MRLCRGTKVISVPTEALNQCSQLTTLMTYWMRKFTAPMLQKRSTIISASATIASPANPITKPDDPYVPSIMSPLEPVNLMPSVRTAIVAPRKAGKAPHCKKGPNTYSECPRIIITMIFFSCILL